MSVSPTFKKDERQYWSMLHDRADQEGISPTEMAKKLIIEALEFDPEEARAEALAGIEQRLDTITRNVARGAFMVLHAAELKAAGEEVPEAEQWVHELMVLKEV